MTTIKSVYAYVFDDVQFGIDVKTAREKAGITQGTLAGLLDWSSGGTISLIETANYSDSLKMKDFLMICKIFDLHAPEYFDLEMDKTVDYFRLMGE